MSFFFDLTKLGRFLAHQCANFEDTTLSKAFFAYDFWPMLIAAIAVGLTLAHKEVYYVLVTWAFTVDAAINWGLREAFSEPGPEAVCFSEKEMPAYASDGITFLAVSFLLSSAVVYRVPLRRFTEVMICVGGPVAVYARVWLRANTPSQLFAGTGFGLLWALLFMLVLKYVFTYGFIAKWFLAGDSWLLGRDFQDTLIRPCSPVLCVNSAMERVSCKLTTTEGMEYARTYEEFSHAQSIREEIKSKLPDSQLPTPPDDSFPNFEPSARALMPIAVTPVYAFYIKTN